MLLRSAFCILILVLLHSAAFAEKRIALVIGNQSYAREVGPLTNPHKDIRIVGAALAKVGFEIIAPVRDANRDQILYAAHDFADRLRAAGPDTVGFLYYSGHGVAVGGDNFLIPVNVKSTTRRDLDVGGVKLTEIINILNESAPQAVHFIVFDACRNNLGGIRGSKGFVPVAEKPGMLIAFSTAPGATASDDGKDSGPYAAALAAELVQPGLNHGDMFFEVRTRVAANTAQEQIPWTQDGLMRRVHFGGEVAKPVEAQPTQARLSDTAEAWGATKDTTNIAVLEAFIARYKDTFFAELARARVDELKKQQMAAVVPPKASEPARETKPAMAEPPPSIVPSKPAAQKIKIGVIFDLTGPLAGGGSELHYLGAKIIIDYFIKQGGVEGHQIEAIYVDAQSKPDVAINESVRLIEQEKVDILLGFFSSAECVPAAARIEQLKKFMWITTCISSALLENRNLKYVFRAQPSAMQFGELSTDFVAQNAKAKLGKAAQDVRVAIIHEDGAYGVDVAKGNELGANRAGFNIVLKEGYSATAPDLSALVTKLKRVQPDVIFHTGYNPDITLFHRQAREIGLKFSALIGHGAGYGVYAKLKEGLGKNVDYLYNVDPISIWLTNQKLLDPKLPPLIAMVGEEYDKAKPGNSFRSAHVGMAASNSYVFFSEVLPRAIKKYGGVDADALRKAALEVDLPEGGTMLGFGVKFAGEGSPVAGQNMRASPVIVQYIDDKSYVVWPKSQAHREPVFPLPSGTAYSPK
jgi:branched-chain amino acid transport system substrate-binding protein